MANKQISDLTATDRTRSGTLLEIQDPTNGSGSISIDNLLLGTQLDTISQMLGYTPANIAEVEAATHALRVTFRPLNFGDGVEKSFSISQHMVACSCTALLLTAAAADFTVFTCGFLQSAGGAGIAFLNKMNVSATLSALAGVRTANVGRIELRQLGGLVGITSGTFSFLLPSIAVAPSLNDNSMRMNQVSPQMMVFLNANPATPTVGTIAGLNYSATESGSPLSEIVHGTGAAVGSQDLQPTPLFDSYSNGKWAPFVMTAGTGLAVNVWLPAAGTSQTETYGVSMQWTEWQPDGGDRT